jgi:hypothetical protein
MDEGPRQRGTDNFLLALFQGAQGAYFKARLSQRPKATALSH